MNLWRSQKTASRNFIKSFAETLESQFLERITRHYGASTVYDPSGGESNDEASVLSIQLIGGCWVLNNQKESSDSRRIPTHQRQILRNMKLPRTLKPTIMVGPFHLSHLTH
jgi:hypothetical protein